MLSQRSFESSPHLPSLSMAKSCEITNVAAQAYLGDRFEVLGEFSKLVYARDHTKCCDHDFQATVLIKSADVSEKDALVRETEVYKALGTQTGFPTLQWFGEWDGLFCIAMDYTGCDLQMLRVGLPEVFDPQTVAIFAIQMIDRIRRLHDVGFIHGDIKPDNFTLGPEVAGYTGMRGIASINLIDFGSAVRTVEETPLTRTSNPAFASIRALLGHPLAKIDDLESLAYTLLYLLVGDEVPWIRDLPACLLMGTDGQQHMAYIKSRIVSEEFCKGLPPVYAKFLRYSRELDARACPDYDYFIKRFKIASGF